VGPFAFLFWTQVRTVSRFDKFVGNEFGQRKRAALELARSVSGGRVSG